MCREVHIDHDQEPFILLYYPTLFSPLEFYHKTATLSFHLLSFWHATSRAGQISLALSTILHAFLVWGILMQWFSIKMCRINIAMEQLLSHNFLKLELQPKVQTQHEHLELLLHFPTLAKFKLHQNKFKSSEYLQGMFCGTIHHWMRNSCEIKQKIVVIIYSSNIIFTRLPKMPAFCAFHCLKNSLDILNAWGP